MTPDNYIKHLEEIILQLTTEKDASLQRIQELEKANEELKKRLRFYENPHTPPSANKLQNAKPSTEICPTPKKRGAPNGHRGATRATKEPDEVIDVIADQCEKCGSSKIEKKESCEKSVIEDIPPPQKIKIISI